MQPLLPPNEVPPALPQGHNILNKMMQSWGPFQRTSSLQIPPTGLGATPRAVDQSQQGAQMSKHGKKEVKGSQGNTSPNLAKKKGPITGHCSPVCPGKS